MPDTPSVHLVCNVSLRAPNASSVGVAGDFNGWTSSPLRREEDGIWRGRTPPLEPMPLTPVSVRYKFVIDGEQWIRDPDNPMEVAGDSVIELPPTRPGPAGRPGRTEEVWFRSEALEREMRYFVWLPPGYDDSHQRYPVIYLLHGYHDGGAPDFLAKGRVDLISAQLLAAGVIPPMILVMPEGEGSFYSDCLDRHAPYERYMVNDLLRDVDARFRTWAQRQGRGIGGLSMGGYGAAKLALQYPDRFVSVGAHAGLYDVRDPAALPEVFGSGPSTAAHRRWNSPLSLIEDPDRTRNLALYFDCGESDHLLSSALKFHRALEAAGVPHRFETLPGFHAWDFVQRRLPVSLAWHARFLRPAGM